MSLPLSPNKAHAVLENPPHFEAFSVQKGKKKHRHGLSGPGLASKLPRLEPPRWAPWSGPRRRSPDVPRPPRTTPCARACRCRTSAPPPPRGALRPPPKESMAASPCTKARRVCLRGLHAAPPAERCAARPRLLPRRVYGRGPRGAPRRQLARRAAKVAHEAGGGAPLALRRTPRRTCPRTTPTIPPPVRDVPAWRRKAHAAGRGSAEPPAGPAVRKGAAWSEHGGATVDLTPCASFRAAWPQRNAAHRFSAENRTTQRAAALVARTDRTGEKIMSEAAS